MPGLRKAYAGGKREKQQNAGMPGPVLRTQGDGFPSYQCTVSKLPQKDGTVSERKRGGYKEKLSSFQARREKEGAGVSKRDVQRYLNKQKKEAQEPINNAFAQALAKINLRED